MNAIAHSTARPNETGSLWLWAHGEKITPVQAWQFNLFAETKPLLIRLAILATIVSLASGLPAIRSPDMPLIMSAEGLRSPSTEPMEQLILEPVVSAPADPEPSDERTDRYAAPEFRATRFSDSGVDSKF